VRTVPEFQIGEVTPPAPDSAWEDPEKWPAEAPNELWLLNINCIGPIGDFGNHEGIIEIRGDSEEIVRWLGQQVVDKLNDPKTIFVKRLKMG
jgi:hypothetical protein